MAAEVRRIESVQIWHTPQDDQTQHSNAQFEKGIDAEGLVRHGHAADTLDELAHEYEATNIVIGRRGSSKLKAHLFGSVASTLVQIADRPVTVVP